MKKLILLLSLLSITSPLFAGSSCYSLYEKKSEEIRKKKAHDVQIGGELVVINGELAYYPGITVPAKINNWAENLLSAIKYGPELYGWSEEYPKKDWLDALYNSIKNHCPLEDDVYRTSLREMMHELMEDGSFCP